MNAVGDLRNLSRVFAFQTSPAAPAFRIAAEYGKPGMLPARRPKRSAWRGPVRSRSIEWQAWQRA